MIPHLDSISPSVLVVDDDRIQRDIIGRIAAGAGCTVATASSFDSAAEQLALRRFDLVTVDLSLGDRDGVELLRLLATLSVRPRVIVVSGCEERILNATIRMVRSVGILDVVGFQKPLSPVRFREALAAGPQIIPAEARCERSAITPSDLRDGLSRLEIYPVFQPKVALSTARVVGCELLARWSSSVLGDVPASEFIALAEQHGQIGALTTTILEQSIEAARGLRRTDPDLTMAVNISAELLSDLNLPETIERMLQRSDVPSRSLVLEITESIAMSDVNRATDILVRLRLKGIGISIDDFGTGYSSLRALAGMPFRLNVNKSLLPTSMIPSSSLMHPGAAPNDCLLRQLHNVATISRLEPAFHVTLKSPSNGNQVRNTYLPKRQYECVQDMPGAPSGRRSCGDSRGSGGDRGGPSCSFASRPSPPAPPAPAPAPPMRSHQPRETSTAPTRLASERSTPALLKYAESRPSTVSLSLRTNTTEAKLAKRTEPPTIATRTWVMTPTGVYRETKSWPESHLPSTTWQKQLVKSDIRQTMAVLSVLALPVHAGTAVLQAACTVPGVDVVCRGAAHTAQLAKAGVKAVLPEAALQAYRDVRSHVAEVPAKLEAEYGIDRAETEQAICDAGAVASVAVASVGAAAISALPAVARLTWAKPTPVATPAAGAAPVAVVSHAPITLPTLLDFGGRWSPTLRELPLAYGRTVDLYLKTEASDGVLSICARAPVDGVMKMQMPQLTAHGKGPVSTIHARSPEYGSSTASAGIFRAAMQTIQDIGRAAGAKEIHLSWLPANERLAEILMKRFEPVASDFPGRTVRISLGPAKSP